jgi:hypothetical protein
MARTRNVNNSFQRLPHQAQMQPAQAPLPQHRRQRHRLNSQEPEPIHMRQVNEWVEGRQASSSMHKHEKNARPDQEASSPELVRIFGKDHYVFHLENGDYVVRLPHH